VNSSVVENGATWQQPEDFYQNFEPLTAECRVREGLEGPVGLKNVGNTCYFNCLVQAYFYLPNFTQKILDILPTKDEK